MNTELNWEYLKQSHTLKIKSAQMPNFLSKAVEANGAIENIGPDDIAAFLPWKDHKDEIEIVDAPNLASIPPSAFAWMPKLVIADISGAQVVGNSAFYSCPSLQTVLMGDVQLIGNSAFSQCKSLEKTSGNGRRWVELRNCRHVSAFAFQGCESITSVTFKKRGERIAEDGHVIQESGTFLEFVGEGAFAGCTSLKSIALGGKDANVSIGENAFYKCPLPE